MTGAMKYPISVGFAALITVGLFSVMELLIAGDKVLPEKKDSIQIAEINMPEQKIETIREEVKPDKPEVPDETPPELSPPKLDIAAGTGPKVAFKAPSLQTNVEGGGFGLSANDGDYLPIVRVEPQYPQRALNRGLEGWCVVEFTVTELGTVDSPRIVDCSHKVFERSTRRAVSKWKYKPKVNNGKPEPTYGVQTLLTYQLADSAK